MHVMREERDNKHDQDRSTEDRETGKKMLDDIDKSLNEKLKTIMDRTMEISNNTKDDIFMNRLKANNDQFNIYISDKLEGVNKICDLISVSNRCFAKLEQDAAALKSKPNDTSLRDFRQNYLMVVKSLKEARTQLDLTQKILNDAKNFLPSEVNMERKKAYQSQLELLEKAFVEFDERNKDLRKKYITFENIALPNNPQINAALNAANAVANAPRANNDNDRLNRASAYCTLYQGLLSTVTTIGGFGLLAWLTRDSNTTTAGSVQKPNPEDLKKWQDLDETKYWDLLAKNIDSSTESDEDFLYTQLQYLAYTMSLSNGVSADVIWDNDIDPFNISNKLIDDYKQQDKYFSDIYREISTIKYKGNILSRYTAAAILLLTIGEILLLKLKIKRKPIVSLLNDIPHARILATSFNRLMATASVSSAPSAKDFTSALLDIAGTLSWATHAGPFISAAIGFGEFLLGQYWTTDDSTPDPWTILYNALKDYTELQEVQKLSNIVATCCSYITNTKAVLKQLEKNSQKPLEFENGNTAVIEVLLGNIISDPVLKTRERSSDGFYNRITNLLAPSGDSLQYVVTTLERDDDFKCDDSNNKYDKDQYSRVKLKYKLLSAALNTYVQLSIYKIKIELFLNNYYKPVRNSPVTFIDLQAYWKTHCHDNYNKIHDQITQRRQNSIGDIARANVDSANLLFSKTTYPFTQFQKEQREDIKARPDPSIGHAFYPNGSDGHLYQVMVNNQPMFKSADKSDFGPMPDYLQPKTWMAYAFLDAADDCQTYVLVDFKGWCEDGSSGTWLLDGFAPKRLATAHEVRNEYRNAYINMKIADDFHEVSKMYNKWLILVHDWEKNQVPNQPQNVKLLKLSWEKILKDTAGTYWNDNNAQVCYGFSFINIIGGETDVIYTDWQKINNAQNPTIKLDEIIKEVNDRVNAIKIYRKFQTHGKTTEEEFVDLLMRGKNNHFVTSWQDTSDASINVREDLSNVNSLPTGGPSRRLG